MSTVDSYTCGRTATGYEQCSDVSAAQNHLEICPNESTIAMLDYNVIFLLGLNRIQFRAPGSLFIGLGPGTSYLAAPNPGWRFVPSAMSELDDDDR